MMAPPKKLPPVNSPWELLYRLGTGAIIAVAVLYLLIGAVLFVVTYSKGGEFTYWPNISLKIPPRPNSSSTLTGTDSSMVFNLIGRYSSGKFPKVTVAHSTGEADSINRVMFDGAKYEIKIVTVHGGSWIQGLDLLPSFKAAAQRVPISLLVVDPSSRAYVALLASNERGFERGQGNRRLDRATFREKFDFYRALIRTDHAIQRHLALHYYSKVPWIRFSIVDGKRATFVITPFLKPGRESAVFYTDDPWLIECLKLTFEEFMLSSRSLSDQEYLKLWE